MVTFLAVLVTFNIILIPLAQSIWGTKLKGYKTIADTRNSIMMIAYSKGNYDILLDINPLWSMMFVIIYYFIAIFIIHAAFHMIQTDALKNVVMMFSLEQDDVPPKVVVSADANKSMSPEALFIAIHNKNVELAAIVINWTFGWMPKEFHLFVKNIENKVKKKVDTDSEGEDPGAAPNDWDVEDEESNINNALENSGQALVKKSTRA